MHPILFEIPRLHFKLSTFGLMVALGFLLGSMIFSKLIARHSKNPLQDVERYGTIPVWVLIGIMLGARILYIVVEVTRGSDTGHEYLSNPVKMLAVWEGGLVMYGGFIGAVVSGVWCARRHKLNVRHALDLGVVAGFFGQAIGRVGCLLVGDDYGLRVGASVTSGLLHWRPLVLGNGGEIGPFTIRVPALLANGHLPPSSLFGDENAGQVLWATQPLMSFKALLVASLALWLLKHRRYEGQVAAVAALTYSVLRFAVELLRGDTLRGVWFGGALSTSQLISIVAGSLALAVLVVNRHRRESVTTA